MFTKNYNNFLTYIYCNDLFDEYPANEHSELDAYQGALIARATLPYIELLDEKNIF